MRSHKLTWGAHWSGWWLRSGRWCPRFPSRCSGPLCSGSALAAWGRCSPLWSCLQTQAAPLATSQITASGKYTQLHPVQQPALLFLFYVFYRCQLHFVFLTPPLTGCFIATHIQLCFIFEKNKQIPHSKESGDISVLCNLANQWVKNKRGGKRLKVWHSQDSHSTSCSLNCWLSLLNRFRLMC